MILGYIMQVDAMSDDRPYDVNNPRASRIDNWRSIYRWVRGCTCTDDQSVLFSLLLTPLLLLADKKRFIFNTWNLIITLACLATAALASYSAIESIISDFQSGSSGTSFSCTSPLQ